MHVSKSHEYHMIAGQRKIRAYWRNYYENTDVVVSKEGAYIERT